MGQNYDTLNFSFSNPVRPEDTAQATVYVQAVNVSADGYFVRSGNTQESMQRYEPTTSRFYFDSRSTA